MTCTACMGATACAARSLCCKSWKQGVHAHFWCAALPDVSTEARNVLAIYQCLPGNEEREQTKKLPIPIRAMRFQFFNSFWQDLTDKTSRNSSGKLQGFVSLNFRANPPSGDRVEEKADKICSFFHLQYIVYTVLHVESNLQHTMLSPLN